MYFFIDSAVSGAGDFARRVPERVGLNQFNHAFIIGSNYFLQIQEICNIDKPEIFHLKNETLHQIATLPAVARNDQAPSLM